MRQFARTRAVSIGTLLISCTLILVGVFTPQAHSVEYEDNENKEDEVGTIEPDLGEDYFENNPEVGDSPWGPDVAACHEEIGCVIEGNSDSDGGNPGNPAIPPGTPTTPGEPCDPVAPVAPTPDATEAVAALTASLGVNPEERGLAGLETWLWVDQPPGQVSWTQAGTPGRNAACAELPAPTRMFTATVDSWTFHIDGDHEQATYSSDTPGTEDEPAASHTFEYVDVYELTLTADLRGAVNRRVRVDRRDYEVIEVRSRLTE